MFCVFVRTSLDSNQFVQNVIIISLFFFNQFSYGLWEKHKWWFCQNSSFHRCSRLCFHIGSPPSTSPTIHTQLTLDWNLSHFKLFWTLFNIEFYQAIKSWRPKITYFSNAHSTLSIVMLSLIIMHHASPTKLELVKFNKLKQREFLSFDWPQKLRVICFIIRPKRFW